VQEFGSLKMKIPPRPHWRPFIKDVRERAIPLRKTLAVKIAKRVNREVLALWKKG
jgi:hypothetical protein